MYDATHKTLDANDAEIRVGDTITDFRGERTTFRGITRVPGDGTATNGKILTDDGEYYPSVFDLTVKPR